VITVHVPPLRERAADLPLLVEHLLGRLAPGKPPPLTRAAWRALAAHGWPGNVRELETALARAVALGGEVIDEHDLPEAIAARAATAMPAAGAPPGDDLRLRPAVDAIERVYIATALERARGNQTVAARLLGLSRFGLQKKLRRSTDESAEED
jgi:DNA-binding NtrC family response regulator